MGPPSCLCSVFDRNVIMGRMAVLDGKLTSERVSEIQNGLFRLVVQNLLGAACQLLNPMTPNDHYSGGTAPLTSKRCILRVYIYSINKGTDFFKRGIFSSFFSYSKCSLFHNSNVFGSCIIQILYTGCAKI